VTCDSSKAATRHAIRPAKSFQCEIHATGLHQPAASHRPVVLPDVLVPDGTRAARVKNAALLFSGGIKKTLVAIVKSTKRGQKKGLFVTREHAHGQ
jgi:hypothetical protein